MTKTDTEHQKLKTNEKHGPLKNWGDSRCSGRVEGPSSFETQTFHSGQSIRDVKFVKRYQLCVLCNTIR